MELPKVFFDAVRGPLFGVGIPQSAVNNMNLIVGFWFENFPNNPLNQLAYVLATVRAEVGQNMQPVREGFASSDAGARRAVAGRRYGRPDGPHGHVYYGRGYVQLTWLDNYRKQGNKLGIDLVANPDLALDPSVAIKILVNGMMDGDFNGQGHGLAFYVNESKQDFVNARRTVNVLDRAGEIAGFARKFLEALTLAHQSGFRPSEMGGASRTGTGQVSNQPSDLIALLRGLLLGSSASGQPTPAPAPPQAGPNAQLVTVLTALVSALAQRPAVSPQPGVDGTVAAATPSSTDDLTPVNAALGQTVGRALNGKKTAISLATVLATVFLPPLAPVVPVLGDVLTGIGDHQSQILPVAGAGALWGALGKIDKWFARRR